jgi:hypothetical protein
MKTEIEPPRKPTGRPSDYSELVAAEICERMVRGEGLLKICSDPDMPARTTVYRWLEANAGFRDRYVRAREALMDFYAEQILVISFDDSGDLILDGDRTIAGHHVVQRARLKVDSLKWVCSRLFPKRYGDRMDLLGDGGSSSTLEIKWIDGDQAPVAPPEPPRQLTFQPQKPPCDLSTEEWVIMGEVLSLIKATIPVNADLPPSEVFSVLKAALLEYCRKDEPPPQKRITLPPRGRSGASKK